MDAVAEIFLGVLDEMRWRFKENGRYNLTRISGLLRLLLVDDEPLIDAVNREHRLDITFAINPSTPLLERNLGWAHSHLEPPFPSSPRLYVKRRKFIGSKCAVYKGYEFTVEDVIRACANLKGGVHLGEPKNKKQEAILLLDKAIRVGEFDVLHFAVVDITRIVLVGLTSLENEIKHKYGLSQ